ncbi:MAG: hypothetical protein V4628_11720 [Pseudomonadota bacterium]
MKERNDCHGDEETEALLRRKPERDPDADRDDFDYDELDAELSARRRTEIALAATPEEFRDMWRKLA